MKKIYKRILWTIICQQWQPTRNGQLSRNSPSKQDRGANLNKPITKREIQSLKIKTNKKLPTNKSPGPDGITGKKKELICTDQSLRVKYNL